MLTNPNLQIAFVSSSNCLAARTQSCHVGGLGEEREERDELVEEMDTKIRELTEAVTSKDRELERLKETVRMLQEKVASSPRGEISAAKEGLRFLDHREGSYRVY